MSSSRQNDSGPMLFRLFSRRLFRALAGISLLLVVLDYVGIGLVLPFVHLTAREVAGGMPGADPTAAAAAAQQRLLLLGGGFALLFVVKTLVAMALRWHLCTALMGGQRQLVSRMTSLVLRAEYRVFLERSPSVLVNTILHLSIYATDSLYALVNILTEAVMLACLLGLAFWLNPKLTGVSLVVLLVLGVFLRYVVLMPMRQLGKMRTEAHRQWFRLSQCVISAARDIKIMNLEGELQEALRRQTDAFTGANGRFLAIQSFPKLAGEMIAVLAIVVGVVGVCGTGASLNANLAVLAAFAAVLTRMAPAVHKLYNAMSWYRYSYSALATLEDTHRYLTESQLQVASCERPFRDAIRLEDVTVSYPGSEEHALDGVSLVIPRGKFTAVVGRSGSGKSTLLDVLAGLLRAESGRILLDGEEADPFRTDTIRRMAGYVPQQVTLFEGSLAYNIALQPDVEPVMARVTEAARSASIDAFINTLPDGYQTDAGEDGVRMSGGQRQRMGIARALFRDPELLLFDEATSAVDAITEDEIMGSVRALSGRRTVVFVTHRLQTVMGADQIIVLDAGHVVGTGTHETLLQDCPQYRALHEYVDGRGPGGL